MVREMLREVRMVITDREQVVAASGVELSAVPSPAGRSGPAPCFSVSLGAQSDPRGRLPHGGEPSPAANAAG